MGMYKSKCQVCGKEYDNYDEFHRKYCCVGCEVATHHWHEKNWKECPHGYFEERCIVCEVKVGSDEIKQESERPTKVRQAEEKTKK